jgi:DNA-binding GntR family transcriptional regulator
MATDGRQPPRLRRIRHESARETEQENEPDASHTAPAHQGSLGSLGSLQAMSAESDDRNSRFKEVVDRLAGGYKTISQLVYEVLKEAIVNGTFAPGEWLRQEWLASAIGVSRIPVRTALFQLESEGLIELHPHRGARVRTLTSAQINEIFRLRALLETHALQRSMQRMTPSRLAEVEALAQHLDDQVEGGTFLDARVRFYRELYDAQDNPLLVQMIEELRGHLGRYLLGIRVDHQHKSHQHAELVAHVASGDFTQAAAWLTVHLEDVRKGIETLVLDDAPVVTPERPAERTPPTVVGRR